MRGFDAVGQRYGHLLVVEKVGTNKHHDCLWRCQCDCGGELVATTRQLREWKMPSCGCVRKNQRRLHHIWEGMKRRCNNPTYREYPDYGGRGVAVCDAWATDYKSFEIWALANGYNDDLTIDRVDVNGNYEPANCRWADRQTQNNNKRTSVKLSHAGETRTLTEWGKTNRIPRSTLRNRLRRGWSIEKSLTEPVRKKAKKRS